MPCFDCAFSSAAFPVSFHTAAVSYRLEGPSTFHRLNSVVYTFFTTFFNVVNLSKDLIDGDDMIIYLSAQGAQPHNTGLQLWMDIGVLYMSLIDSDDLLNSLVVYGPGCY